MRAQWCRDVEALDVKLKDLEDAVTALAMRATEPAAVDAAIEKVANAKTFTLERAAATRIIFWRSDADRPREITTNG